MMDWYWWALIGVSAIAWYAGWILSGGLIPPPHETMSEGE